MCSIAGFIGFDPRLDDAMLLRMQSAQRHRGPDDSGITFQVHPSPDGNKPALRMGMAHNRLSILDLSEAGHQPMSTPDQQYWICYNGEFFNSPSHRAQLVQQGITFHSTSDTEVLLHMCARDGLDASLPKVNGMFAFSLYDHATATLSLARDRAGKKPLYYVLLADGSLLYASELSALLATGLVDQDVLDPQAFDHYWTLGYTTGERTLYGQIRRLRPGCMATWHHGQWEIGEYWRLRFEPLDDSVRSMDDYADELTGLLEDAVNIRMLSDVPVGLCLSGGVDSALMALMMSRLRTNVPAYSIAFEGGVHDESEHATALASHLGLPHQVLKVDAGMETCFPSIARWFGEPFGDMSAIPMYFLSEMIRRHATVAITGDGGDELFGGYHHYREGVRLWGKPLAERIFNRAGVSPRDYVMGVLGADRGFPLMQRHVNGSLRCKLYGPDIQRSYRHSETLRERRQWMIGARNDALAAMQDCDFHTYMTDDVLRKVDHMSMAHGLECRSPFMDFRVMEFAAKLPFRMKLSPSGEGKVLLRHILTRHIPEHLHRRPKQGFTPPWEKWCAGAMRQKLRKDWKDMDDPYTQRDAIDWLVPESGGIVPVLSWMAYSYVQWKKGIHGCA